MQTTSTIFMVRPVNFAFNEQTAISNAFQKRNSDDKYVHKNALKEFDELVLKLQENGVKVIIIEDQPEPHTPDSIFPNNWISSHEDGRLFIYPMEAKNRRFERRPEVLEELRKRFKIESETDLTYFESEEKYLEGTGSMVLDRQNKLAYACISPRTDQKVLNIFCDLTGYKPIVFHAFGPNGQAVYHTNVMMCIAESFAVVCLESITDATERQLISDSLRATGRELIEISLSQMTRFAGNMLQLNGKNNEKLLIMSRQALQSLSEAQVALLESYCKIVSSPLDTIETYGGGSARCMIAEIFLNETEI